MPPDADLHGVFPCLGSPLDNAGRVNRTVLARLVEHLIEAGGHGRFRGVCAHPGLHHADRRVGWKAGPTCVIP
jgi:hypothetical protein